MNKEQVSFYNQNALWQKESAKYLVNIIQQNININQIDKIIDIGCGTGFTSKELLQNIFFKKQQDINLTLLDYSEEMLIQAKQEMNNFNKIDNINVNYVNSKFEYYNFTDEKYDLLISNIAMHWFKSFEISLLKCIQIAKKSIIAIPLDSSLFQIKQLYQCARIEHNLIDFPKLETICNILDKNNTSYQYQVKSFYQHKTLYQIYKEWKQSGMFLNKKSEIYNNQEFIQKSANLICRNRKDNHILDINWDILYLVI